MLWLCVAKVLGFEDCAFRELVGKGVAVAVAVAVAGGSSGGSGTIVVLTPLTLVRRRGVQRFQRRASEPEVAISLVRGGL